MLLLIFWKNILQITVYCLFQWVFYFQILPVDSGHLTQNESVSSKSIKYSISEVDI